jgi:hypothetical protein
MHTILSVFLPSRCESPFGRVQLKCDGTRWRTGREKWRGNWRMECLASTLHTTSEHAVSSTTTADEHTSAASSRLNWRPPPIQMDSSVSPKDEICFLRVCHHISNAVYCANWEYAEIKRVNTISLKSRPRKPRTACTNIVKTLRAETVICDRLCSVPLLTHCSELSH